MHFNPSKNKPSKPGKNKGSLFALLALALGLLANPAYAANGGAGATSTTNAAQADSVDLATGRITIGSLVIGATEYRNIVLLPGNLVSYSTAAATATDNAFDLATGQLTIRSLMAGGVTYTNVVVTVASVISIGSSLPKYALFAATAQASILNDQPIMPNPVTVNYLFEAGVPQGNKDLIRAGVDNFVGRFSNILRNSNRPVGILAYSTLAGGEALAKSYDPGNAAFQEDMTNTFRRQFDPASVTCMGMGGFSVGYVGLVVMGAPCFTNAANEAAVVTHELTHQVQSAVNGGMNPREIAPVWLTEGQAQVVGSAMSVRNGADNFVAARASWVLGIRKDRSVADLQAMEGETGDLADTAQRSTEYNVGAGLSEYLIAKFGFKKSLDVLQLAKAQANGSSLRGAEILSNFRLAFQTTYGQTLDDFYLEALPYINFLATHSPTASDASTEAGTRFFLTEGCHGMVDATLQKQVGDSWIDVAAAKGWDYAPSPECPANTYRSWTIADVSKGTVLRWHVYATGHWDWYSRSYTY